MNEADAPRAPSWQAVLSQTETALACGALRSFETRQGVIEDGGMRFILQHAVNLARKEQASKLAEKSAADTTAAWRDPFSPCEAALRVGDIGERHFLLLNKFNVLAHHLLIVTTQFEPQESLLNEDDFAALFACLNEFDGLGFYNGGAVAGSSQPHKHLQMVPLAPDGLSLPIDSLIEAARADGVFNVPQLPFEHAATWLGNHNAQDRYRSLLDAISVNESTPYNLLVTRRWMFAVPRAISHVEGVAVNALGFAGSLFVRDDAQRAVVESLGPMKLLARACGRPAHDTP